MPHKPDEASRETVQTPGGEIYIEYKQIGQSMKVTAVDAATGMEVVIQGPAATSQDDLERVAVRKLKRQLAKAREDAADGDGTSDPEDGSKGWIV